MRSEARIGAVALAAVVAAGVIAVIVVAFTHRSATAQTLGVPPLGPVAGLAHGSEVCQRPIGLADDVDAVRFTASVGSARAGALRVTLRSLAGRTILGEGAVAGRFSAVTPLTVQVGHVRRGPRVALCFRNTGRVAVDILGDEFYGSLCTPEAVAAARVPCVPGRVRPTITSSAAFQDGNLLRGDVSADFLQDHARSLVARAPLIVARASLFRPGFVGPALWWVLVACWLVAIPVALVLAVRAARAA